MAAAATWNGGGAHGRRLAGGSRGSRGRAVIAPVTRAPPPLGAPRPEGAGLTHRGRVRSRNEDAILTDPSGVLWAVADGMGGHGHGDVASDIVIERLASIPDEAAAADPEAALVAEIERANAQVRARAQALGATGGMGATVVAMVIRRAVAHLAWVGDSRAYLCRRGVMRLLTRDHTVVQDLLDRGELGAEEAQAHPESHVVTRAVGGDDGVEVDVTRAPLLGGDWLLLCSDGLTACLDDGAVAQALAEAPSPDEACRRLLLESLEAGAPDNVSVVAVRMREG